MDLATIGFKADTGDLKVASVELDKLAKAGEKTEKAIDKSMDGISGAFQDASGRWRAASGRFLSSAEKAQMGIKSVEKSAASSSGAISVSFGTIAKSFASLAGVLGAGGIGAKLIETERDTGIMTASLKVATGSAENASEAFAAIQRLATQLPESVDSVSNAFIKLTNLGLDPSESAIKSYSNTAAAMGKDLNQMIEAVADAATGEFERLKEFGIKSKQQGDQVSFTFRGVTTTVAKEADAITGYLRQIGDVTFAGAATEQMKTLDGAISNLGDTWDGLFRAINNAGVGDFIASTVRMATGAIQELSDLIASGQLGAYIDAIGLKFSGFAGDARAAFEQVASSYDWLKGMLAPSAGGIADAIVDGFKKMPENIRAFIQIAAVEIAHLVEKSKLYGEQIAWYLNPKNLFSDAPDMAGAFSALDQAREESITIILQERDAAISSYDAMIKKAGDLRAEYDAGNAATLAAGDVLGQYAVKAEQAATATAEIPKQLKAVKDAVSKIELGEWDSFDDALGKENKQWEQIERQKEEMDALIQSVDDFGGAWTRTGDTIADALGSIVDQFDNYQSHLEAITQKEMELAEAKKNAFSIDDVARLTAAEKKMAEERTKANVSGYRAMAGAAASMFKEQSKERKALTAIEQAMTAIELALSLKRGLAAASEAVANQGKGDPYTAWARMAAMAVVMAGLGYAVGGIGGGGGGGTSAEAVQESQGTGTVLGSNDKSESMINAMEAFGDIAIDQLSELRGIREGLSGLSGATDRLAMGVSVSGLTDQKYLNFADTHLGVALESGNFELYGQRGVDRERRAALAPLQSQFVDIFKHIGNVISLSMDSLGLTTQESLNSFYLQVGKVSFEGLSGEEIQSELNAIFSQQADLITGHLVPAMREYQQMGEGLFETLTRVAKEQAVFDDTIENIGLSLDDLSTMMRIDVAQSVIQLMGGLDEFREKTTDYFDAFFTESEKMDMLAASLDEAFGSLNLSMPQSRDEFRALVEGLDLTTEAGQRMFANLMELVPGLDDYIKGLEKNAEAQQSAADKLAQAEEAANKAAESAAKRLESQQNNLVIRLLEEQGKAEEALAMRRQLELEAMDESLRSIQEQIYAQQDLNAAAKESAKAIADAAAEMERVASERYSLETRLLQAQGDTAALRQRELELLDESNRPLQQMIWAIEDQRAAAEEAARAEDERRQAAQAAADERKRQQEQSIAEAKRIAEEQKRIIEGTQNAITSAIRALRGESEQLNDIDRQRAKNTLSAALSAAQAGQSIIGFAGLEDALQAVQKIDKSQFASAEAYQREVGQTLSILERLGGYAGIAPKTPIPTTSPVVPIGTVSQAQTTQQLAVNVQNMEAQMLDLTKRIEKNTKTNADLMQRWEAIGMPATR